MVVYQIRKQELEDRDFLNANKIHYSDDNIIIIKYRPRKNKGEHRKKVVISSPGTRQNWDAFRKYYFGDRKA